MGWESPTGFVDPDTQWANEPNAYDENTDSYAQDTIGANSWGSFLELTISAVTCSSLRFYASMNAGKINEIDLDAYYDGDWHHVYQGVYSPNTWVEKTLGASYSVTKARVKGYNNDASNTLWPFKEFDFWEVEAFPTVMII